MQIVDHPKRRPRHTGDRSPVCRTSPDADGHQPQRKQEVTMSTENEIREIVSLYTRAADRRDGAAMAALFESDAVSEVYLHGSGGPDDREPLGKLTGAAQIEAAVTEAMAPHPSLGWSHHTTYDHMVSVDGEQASIETQFITFNVVGAAKPEGGWPAGTFGAQGTITPIESGYYRFNLRRTDGAWKIRHQEVIHDIPYAF
jgi:SnoaL-like domain